MNMKHIFYILILIMCVISMVFLSNKLIDTISEDAEVKKSYEFLSNYVCWNDVFNVTLYTTCPRECSKDKEHRFFGITYSGVRAVPYRTIAVDPKVIPLGSILVDAETGYVFIAEDTGNKVKGKHVDLFVGQATETNKKLLNDWGQRKRQFFVIENRKRVLHIFPFKMK